MGCSQSGLWSCACGWGVGKLKWLEREPDSLKGEEEEWRKRAIVRGERGVSYGR